MGKISPLKNNVPTDVHYKLTCSTAGFLAMIDPSDIHTFERFYCSMIILLSSKQQGIFLPFFLKETEEIILYWMLHIIWNLYKK